MIAHPFGPRGVAHIWKRHRDTLSIARSSHGTRLRVAHGADQPPYEKKYESSKTHIQGDALFWVPPYLSN